MTEKTTVDFSKMPRMVVNGLLACYLDPTALTEELSATAQNHHNIAIQTPEGDVGGAYHTGHAQGVLNAMDILFRHLSQWSR